ncbi:hypothetical protein PHYSODRAFT_529150, partial [Phytophthora sojae]
WDVTFFGCFSSLVPNCFMSTICPCVAIAQIQARLGNCYATALYGHSSTIFDLLIIFLCGAAFFVLFYAFSLCLVRMKVRKEFEIKGSIGVDCLASTCCAPCTVAQMASQMQSYTPGSCSFQQPGVVDTLPGYPVTPAMQFI